MEEVESLIFFKKNNHPIKMLNGRRITDKKTLDYALMIYAGKINKEIVAKLQSLKINSLVFAEQMQTLSYVN